MRGAPAQWTEGRLMQLRRLYRKEIRRRDIASALGVTFDELRAQLRKMELPQRTRGKRYLPLEAAQ